jgi:hypothetical protein
VLKASWFLKLSPHIWFKLSPHIWLILLMDIDRLSIFLNWTSPMVFFWCRLHWGFCLLQDLFFEWWVCKSNCFLFFIFFYLTCVLGCDGLGWIFGFFLVSYALGFLSSTRYVFEWWFCKSNFFFLTYVLGCDGLVWILAPRDIDNV